VYQKWGLEARIANLWLGVRRGGGRSLVGLDAVCTTLFDHPLFCVTSMYDTFSELAFPPQRDGMYSKADFTHIRVD
jgi:hypothetical protein